MELRLENTKIIENKKVDNYKIGRYTIKRVTYPDDLCYITIKSERGDYMPEIYFRENESKFEIQTTSYGALSIEETKKVVDRLKEAIEVVEVLNKELVK